jgi:nucleoside 2-deoxyribosyltransferase
MELQPPLQIRRGLRALRQDYPKPATVGFIMIKFTPELEPIVASIREALSPHGLVALLASDKSYEDDLLPNVKIYMWGCGFGIAVFDKLSAMEFNPNVAFELGFMLALQKPVLILSVM